MNPQLIAALIGAALCFAAGWSVEGWRKDAEISRLQADHQTEKADAATAAASDLADAQVRGDALQLRLAASESARDQLAQEKDREIRRLTTGRACLSGAAVRLLNRPPALKLGALPEAAGEPVRADAAFATDTDVGLWAGHARDQYDACRERLQAIADFYAGSE